MTTRRALVAGAGAALACGLNASARAAYNDIPPLKATAPYPLGVCAKYGDINDPAWAALAVKNFSRLTPEWEMKMEYILQKDGRLQFDRPDALVNFARQNGMAMHGHTLIWYAEDGDAFQALAKQTNNGKPDAFLNFYVDYIHKVVGRYAGRIGSWDVVNEPVNDDGNGLRDCLWRKVLGDDYAGLAFEAAHQADPHALLFMNEYWLEKTPAKRRTFLKLCETLLKNGAPLHGIGTQTHLVADIAPGAIRTAMRDIASLGLKIHVSEVDISLQEDRPGNIVQPRLDQLRALGELLDAYHEVPAHQRFGMTFWGLRDGDSWLNNGSEKHLIPDEPLLFDAHGRPKPLARAFASAAK